MATTQEDPTEKVELACDIANEHFGTIPHLVVSRLVHLGPATLAQLAKHCQENMPVGLLYDHTKLRRALVVLLQHGCVQFQQGAPTRYYCLVDMLLLRLKHPSVVHTSKLLFGDEGGHMAAVLLKHGKASEDKLLELCLNDPSGPLAALPPDALNRKLVHMRNRLSEMMSHHYVEPAPRTNLDVEEHVQLSGLDLIDKSLEKNKRGRKRKRDAADDEIGCADDPLRGMAHNAKDEKERREDKEREKVDMLLRVNLVKYLHHQRNQEAMDLVKRLVNDASASVVDALLKQPQRVSQIIPQDLTKSLSCIPRMPKMSLPIKDEHLVHLVTLPEGVSRLKETLTGLSQGMAQMNGDSILRHTAQGGWSVNNDALARTVRDANTELILARKFDPLGRRIYKVLLSKRCLEEKDVAAHALASETDVRRYMYRMKVKGYLSVREVPTTADFSPARTIFLWHVVSGRVRSILLAEMYKTLRNMYQKRLHEAKQVHPLIARVQHAKGSTVGLTEAQQLDLHKWNLMSESLSFTVVSMYDSICSLEYF